MATSSRVDVLDTAAYVHPLVTDIENLASSCFLKIAVIFAKLERLARMRPPADARSCALAWTFAKPELLRVSETKIAANS